MVCARVICGLLYTTDKNLCAICAPPHVVGYSAVTNRAYQLFADPSAPSSVDAVAGVSHARQQRFSLMLSTVLAKASAILNGD
jgi:hypothetical protein